MFDKVCNDNGITHLLTAPYSPTTTGKVERLHKTIRAEFLTEHDRKHATIESAQAALDAWVVGRRRNGLRSPIGAWSSSTSRSCREPASPSCPGRRG